MMNRDVCKETNRCSWVPGNCRVSVNNCDGTRPNICNATRKCIYLYFGLFLIGLLHHGTCLNTNCLSAYSSSDCNKENTYNSETHPCKWLDSEKVCVARDTCSSQVS